MKHLTDDNLHCMKEIFVSVVMPVHSTDFFIADYLNRMTTVMRGTFEHYEIIVVDNGANEETASIIKTAQRQIPGITLLVLSSLGGAQRNVADTTIIAGLDHAIGDMVVILDPRLDQPELVPQMVEATFSGADIIYALPQDRVSGSGLSNVLANMFIRLIGQAKGIELPMAISSCRLLSRSALNFILKSADRHRILILAPALSGYCFSTIRYEREYPGYAKQTQSRRLLYSRQLRNAGRSIQRALDLVFAVSVTPLRAVSFLALTTSVLALIYSIYVVGFWVVSEEIAPGWASLSLQISGLFFMTSLVLAVMSEYLLRTLESTGRRPIYYLIDQSHSTVSMHDKRLNVVGQ